MFESLSESLTKALDRLTARGRLTEVNIREGMREVRRALLEADVHYKVVKDFIDRVTEKAVGDEVIKSIRPGQQIVKIVKDELVQLLGPGRIPLAKSPSGPTVILVAGLQGSGKTTTCAKLAKMLDRKGGQPLLVAADTQRPAAVEQLKVLGEQIGVPVYSEPGGRPPRICERAVRQAKETDRDYVILDTAGRLHIDERLMAEVKEIADRVEPHEVLLVCDAMTGQDAVQSAKEFDAQLSLTGVILTKMDGDARGGAALSVRAVTGKVIRYIGTGEKAAALEEFHAEGMASRILGMGDVVSLVEKAQSAIDVEEATRLRDRLLADTLNMEDFRAQLRQLRKLGSLKDWLGLVPGLGSQLKGMDFDEKEIWKFEAIINSMTPRERRQPDVLNPSRRARIASGSGTQVVEVNRLVKEFKHMKKMLKGMRKSGALESMMGPGALKGMGKKKAKKSKLRRW
ncbi:MAG: signal recognition particle protein [Planctomycetota bacterium]|nr:signal recognition particle protein [Planctomycetota bacterium]